jgi:hypothetical protein
MLEIPHPGQDEVQFLLAAHEHLEGNVWSVGGVAQRVKASLYGHQAHLQYSSENLPMVCRRRSKDTLWL